MHTVIMVGAGLAALAVFVVGAALLGKPAAASARWSARAMLYGYTLSSALPTATKAGICAGIAGRALKDRALLAYHAIRDSAVAR